MASYFLKPMRFAVLSLSTTFVITVVVFGCAAMTGQSAFFSSGTSIVIVKTSDEIVVAADSMQTHPNDDPRPPSFTECKIRRVGDNFFAIAGHIREETTSFDAPNIAIQVLKTTGNLEGKIKLFEQMIETPLRQLVIQTRQLARTYFEKQMRNKLILQIAFFGVERQSPYLYLRDLRSKVSESNDDISIEFSEIDCGANCPIAILGSDGSAAEKYLNANQPRIFTSLELVKTLIDLEIKNQPSKSGPPVDIVKIDAKYGPRWISRKPECTD